MKDLIEVKDSSSLTGLSYDPDSQTLAVMFKSGEQYTYFEVPEDVAASLAVAESKGKFLAKSIKGKYEYVKVKPPAPEAE